VHMNCIPICVFLKSPKYFYTYNKKTKTIGFSSFSHSFLTVISVFSHLELHRLLASFAVFSVQRIHPALLSQVHLRWQTDSVSYLSKCTGRLRNTRLPACLQEQSLHGTS